MNGDESLGVLFEFEPVNEKETNLQVKEFFDKDVQKLQDLASETLQGIIKSPSFDGIGSADHSINKSEEHYIRVVDAKNELEIIAKAINDCPALSKKILNLRFICYEIYYIIVCIFNFVFVCLFLFLFVF